MFGCTTLAFLSHHQPIIQNNRDIDDIVETYASTFRLFILSGSVVLLRQACARVILRVDFRSVTLRQSSVTIPISDVAVRSLYSIPTCLNYIPFHLLWNIFFVRIPLSPFPMISPLYLAIIEPFRDESPHPFPSSDIRYEAMIKFTQIMYICKYNCICSIMWFMLP